jgi:uncharacterized protein involved in exopolysaccharide biosynthesis
MEQMEMGTSELPRTSLRDFLRVLFKRKTQILLFFAVTSITVAAATFIAKPTYQAVAQILVKLGRENIYVPASGSSNPVINFNREEQINSEIEILKSRSLATEVLHQLGPETIYEDIANGSGRLRAAILPSKGRARTSAEKALLKMQKALDVQGIKKSNVIEVSFKHTDPETATAVVNKLSNLFLDRHLSVHKTPQSYEFFQQQSEFLKDKLNTAEARLQELKEKYDLTALDEQQSILLNQTAGLRTVLNETLSRTVEVENRIDEPQQLLATVPKTIPQGERSDHNPFLITSLEARLVELQLKEKDLLTKYTEQNRLVINVIDEIRMVQQKLIDFEKKRYGTTRSGVNLTHQQLQQELLRSKADYRALMAKSQVQRGQLANYKKELDQFNRVETTYNQLQQAVDVDRQNHRLYLTKFEESRISDAMDSEKIASVSLIEPAQVPLKPISPRVLLNLVLGLFLGTLGGLGLAFFLEYLDDSLGEIDDVEEQLKLPVLGLLPELEKNNEPQTHTLTGTNFFISVWVRVSLWLRKKG